MANSEITAKQMELATISSSCDALGSAIAIEGSTILKNRVQELKSKMTDLADLGRQRMNKLSDAIAERLTLFYMKCSENTVTYGSIIIYITGRNSMQNWRTSPRG